LTEYTAYAKYEETDTHYESEVSDKTFETKEEILHPGPPELIAGDESAGFYGEVPASELITGDSLASKIGLSSGTSHFSNEPWLKFSYEGKLQYVAKKTYRYNLSWAQINALDAVYGDKIIEIDGKEYKLRLMRAANEDPASSSSGSVNHHSEWNKLMLPIH